jgi:endoglycosylceramidase
VVNNAVVRRLGSLVMVVVATVLLGGVPLAFAAPAQPLGHAGRWITDAQGRVVILHGFNTVPVDENHLPRDIGMDAEHAQWLADNGFNTIRLGLYYARVEPTPGQFDESYLADYLRVQRELADRGIFTLLDMHQDQLNRQFGGGPVPGTLPSRGFPDWFVKTDGVPSTDVNYPSGYLFDPALNRAYDNVWNDFPASDGASVQTHLARGWQFVIAHFRDRPGMLGYDLFNEPWPGSAAASCAGPAGCPPGGFDQTLLTAFSRRLVSAARAADPAHLAFYEPNLEFDFGAATGVGDVGDPGAGFSFHDYCLQTLAPTGQPSSDQCQTDEVMAMDNAEAQSRRTGDALLMSEIGFDPAAAYRIAALADARMLSWQWWDYYPANLDFSRPNWPALIRPYPQLISGTPTPWSYDPQTKRFSLVYSTRRAAGRGAVAANTAPGQRFPAGSPTEIFVPQLQYPHGYGVAISGAEVAGGLGIQHLLLRNCAGEADVQLTITPGASSAPASCAEQPTHTHGSGLTIVLSGSSRTCARRRSISFRIARSRGVRVASATIYLNGRRVRVVRGRALRRTITVRNLPRGKLRLKIVARTTTGRRLIARRTYPACR